MEKYQPNSPFLLDILAGLVPLSGSEFAEANLGRLIEMTRDEDRANRDWATFLLAQQEQDTPAVRDALISATNDVDEDVRAEAIWGLAHLDRDLALPLVQKALLADRVGVPVVEAATLIAHGSLIEPLRQWSGPSDDPYFDSIVAEALRACEAAIPSD